MKRIMLSTIVSATLLLSLNGCSDKKSNEKTAVKAIEKQVNTVSKEIREKALHAKLESFTAYGFDVNKTSANTYMLTVKSVSQVTESMLGLLNLNTLDVKSKSELEKVIGNRKIGVEIDWDKYVANEKESLLVYDLGHGKEAAYMSKLLKNKKLAAYLSYNGKDQLTQVKIKDIDETVTTEPYATHLELKGMYIDMLKPFVKGVTADYAYTLHTGSFKTNIKTDTNDTIIFSYADSACNVDKQNAYLGTVGCTFPDIDVSYKTALLDRNIDFSMKDTAFEYITTLHDKKVKADMNLSIASMLFEGKGTAEEGKFVINDIKVFGNMDNMDESIMKTYMEFINNPPKDKKMNVKELMSYVGKMYSMGMTFDYTTSAASIEGESKESLFKLDSYKARGKGVFSKTIEYKENSTIQHISLTDKVSNKTTFDIENLKLGYGINKFYNIFPAFMEFSADLSEAQQAQTGQEPVVPKKVLNDFANKAKKIINDGFGLSLAPIGWDTLQVEVKGETVKVGKLDFNIDANLKKNDVTIDMNNPMAMMMLIPYLQANGKLVLSKQDVEKISKNAPAQMQAMIMMFAKLEGDNAVFDLKFENGHLLINGKPVM